MRYKLTDCDDCLGICGTDSCGFRTFPEPPQLPRYKSDELIEMLASTDTPKDQQRVLDIIKSTDSNLFQLAIFLSSQKTFRMFSDSHREGLFV